PTPNIEESISFYTKLGFKLISASNPCIVSDGKVFIEINPDKYARAGLKFYQTSWEEEIKQLQAKLPLIKFDHGALFADRSGVWNYLIEGEMPIKLEAEEQGYGYLGNYAGLSMETIDIAAAAEIYEILGFEKTMGGPEQAWAAYQKKEGIAISLMKPMTCPHLFFNPSLTYFNGGKNLPIIQKIREVGVDFTEGITVFNKEGIIDNVIIRDPGGFGFFIFND
ncbi:MAG: hypothetical protein AAF696_13500, partial [Bacteroidota bacterium]